MPKRICAASFETLGSRRGSMPVTLAAVSRPAKRITDFDCTEGATAPGSQPSSAAIMAKGFLMPGRNFRVVRPWISAASKATSAGWRGGSRRSSVTEIWGSESTSCVTKSSCEPSIRAAIITEKPTPMATPVTPTSVWRRRERMCVFAMEKARPIMPLMAWPGCARANRPGMRSRWARRQDRAR